MPTVSEEATHERDRAGTREIIWPKISLITAVYNGETYLEDTIRSIISQGYPNLEYIVVDDGSTDGTPQIIKKYEQHLSDWITQANQGLYAALNAGFAKSTGEILGWLNSSDMLHTRGLFVVGSVFSAFREVQWLTGLPTLFHEHGWPIVTLELPHWTRKRFLAGANRHIQQESTYWRRELWESTGAAMNTEYRAEGDFELWVRFFRKASLYTVNAQIAGWRFHRDALSHGNIERYNRTCDEIVERELRGSAGLGWVKLCRKITESVRAMPVVRGVWRRTVLTSLYKMPGPDWAPTIEYTDGQWEMRKR